MKSERRHELQENELAAVLGRWNKAIEPYSKLIAIAVAAVFLAAIALGIYSSRISENRSDSTLELLRATGAGDAESLALIADNYPESSAAPWARLYQGDQYLAQGMSVLFNDRAQAETLFEQANEAFAQALRGEDRIIQSRANFGMARVAEGRGKSDEAIAAYEKTIAANESEQMVALAERRIEALSSDKTREFLTWFNEQEFAPPADPSLPPSLPGLDMVPDFSNLSMPPVGGDAGRDSESGNEESANDEASTDSDAPTSTGISMPETGTEPESGSTETPSPIVPPANVELPTTEPPAPSDLNPASGDAAPIEEAAESDSSSDES